VSRACALAAALLASAPLQASATPAPARSGAPISSHAMVHTCCTPAAMKERIFAEAKAMGARFIRVDVELSGIFPSEGDPGDDAGWERLDEVTELSRRHRLPVLGIVMSPPAWMSLDDAAEFGRMAGEVAERARGTVTRWEIVNEPDGSWAFQGTPEQYARMLRAAYDAIGKRVPEAQVAMGGVMTPADPAWIERVLATPGADAARAFDIANVHLRGHARWLPGQLAGWRELLARHGFAGPVWVTEHGYPGDPAYQSDPVFQGGEAGQAAFLTESVLALAEAGADEVFVTLRDNLDGGFASEGVTSIAEQSPYPARRKPAFAAMRRLVDRWDELTAARAEQRSHEAAMAQASAQAAAADLNVRAQRALARTARAKLSRLRARHRSAVRPGARERLRRRVREATRALRDRQSGVGWARASAFDYRLRAELHRTRAAQLAAFVAGG
jgi:hypothetical protein